MRRTCALLLITTALMGTVMLAGCGSDAKTSQTTTERYEKAKATQDRGQAIIADPTAFGTPEEVLDMLEELAVPGALSVDEVFGTTDYIAGLRYTLFAGRDSVIKTWRTWLSDDGSTGGSLWTWSGTALNGEPFDLEGVNIDHYNEKGLLSEVVVFYPYEDEEVRRRYNEGN